MSLVFLLKQVQGRVGENAPLKDYAIYLFFLCEAKVKCVQNNYHSFSDNDINYKPNKKCPEFSNYWNF